MLHVNGTDMLAEVAGFVLVQLSMPLTVIAVWSKQVKTFNHMCDSENTKDIYSLAIMM